MSRSKKVNPRRRPANMADVNRAKDQAANVAMRCAIYMMLWVLVNDLHFTHDQIQVTQDRLNDLTDSIARGYVDYGDIARTLEDEYELTLRIG